MTTRILSRFLFVVILVTDTILLLLWLRPGYWPDRGSVLLLPIQVLQALFFNSALFWRVTVPIVAALSAIVLTKKIRARPPRPRVRPLHD